VASPYDGRVALDVVGIAVALALLGARTAYRHLFSPYARARRELAKVPVDAITPQLQGHVHIAGEVRPYAGTLTAPLSQISCVAYELELHVGQGRGWKQLLVRRDALPFTLGQGNAWALIEPHANFELGLRDDLQGSNRWYSSADPEHLWRLRGMLGSMGVELYEWLGIERSFRFRESVLEAGDRAAVQGLVAAADRPTDPSLAVVLRGTPQDIMLIADAPPARAGLDRSDRRE
jgi:hypothetical protein